MYLSDNPTALIILGSVTRKYSTLYLNSPCTVGLFTTYCARSRAAGAFEWIWTFQCLSFGLFLFTFDCSLPNTNSQKPMACRWIAVLLYYKHSIMQHPGLNASAAKHWARQNQKQRIITLIQTQSFIIKIQIQHNCIINSILSCLILIKDVLNLNASPS